MATRDMISDTTLPHPRETCLSIGEFLQQISYCSRPTNWLTAQHRRGTTVGVRQVCGSLQRRTWTSDENHMDHVTNTLRTWNWEGGFQVYLWCRPNLTAWNGSKSWFMCDTL